MENPKSRMDQRHMYKSLTLKQPSQFTQKSRLFFASILLLRERYGERARVEGDNFQDFKLINAIGMDLSHIKTTSLDSSRLLFLNIYDSHLLKRSVT